MTEKEILLYERVVAFDEGRLSADEEKVFRTDCKTAPELAKMLDFVRGLRGATALAEKDQLKAVIELESRAYQRKRQQRRIGRGLAVAACLSLLIFFALFQRAPKSLPEIARFVDTDTLNSTTLMGTVDRMNEDWSKAKGLFDQAAYSDVIPILNELVLDTGFHSHSEANLYLGYSLLSTDSLENAAAAFDLVSSGSIYRGEADWYLSLVHLYADDKATATKFLQKVAADGSQNRRETAEEILEDLK